MSDDLLRRGAANAVNVCMAVGPADRVVVVTDIARRVIGEALAAEATAAGASIRTLLLEDFTARPATGYPEPMQRQVAELNPTVSFFAATALPGELAFRRPYMDQVIYQLKARHGHMVGIDERLMREGMQADYREIARITNAVTDAVRDARHIEVTSPSGTHLVAGFNPSLRRWYPCHGLYHEPGTWGNLPEGETFTSPMAVDGVMGAEVLGDHFSAKYGVLPAPALFHIEGGRVRKVDAPLPELAAELEEYLNRDPEGRRVGEYAIGTNIALTGLSGNLLQDEKLPGVHIAFGYPYPNETGADWTATTHLDIVATRSTITVDGQVLMRDGAFAL
ncbi:MAG TPA: aminopeptidase [Actinomycetota bacterium]|nr:aminopeptidase [Actinomycetota bacterium]